MPELAPTSGPRTAHAAERRPPQRRPAPPPPTTEAARGGLGADAWTREIAERAIEVAYRTALGVTRDPDVAADVAQEVAIKAIGRAGQLRDSRALGAWLHRTAVHAAIDHHRRSTSRRVAEDGFAARSPSAHHDEPELGSILALLAELPARQRAAMTLRYVHDLDDRRIARALGCRTGTVRSLLSRATATLRDRLDPTTTPKDPR